MSRPKIGSTTVWVGENGTRWIHSSSVSHAPGHGARDAERQQHGDPGDGPRPERDDVGHVLGVEAEARARHRPTARRPPRTARTSRRSRGSGRCARPGAGRRRAGRRRSCRRPGRSGSTGGVRRFASRRLPRSTISARRPAPDEQARLDAEARPEHAVVADALVPDGVGPEVDARGEQHEDREDRDEGDPDPGAADDVPDAGRPGTVIRPADGARAGLRRRRARAPASTAGGERRRAARARGCGGLSARHRDRPPPVSSSSAAAGSSAACRRRSPCRRRRPGRAGRGRRVPSGRPNRPWAPCPRPQRGVAPARA